MRQLSDLDRVEILPILPSLDIAETLIFYQTYLGFDETVYRDDGYLILRRRFCDAPMELHFWRTDDRDLCEKTAVYIRGGGIDQLHVEFAARSTPRLSEMAVRPWNMEEFYVWDVHGNLLKFGRTT